MCGRYYRRSDKQRIAEAMHAYISESFEMEPDYNIAPTTLQPVVRIHQDTGDRELTPMRWGLIPSWATDTKLTLSTHIARAESITTSRTYRDAFNQRRILVPADGFFEWRKTKGHLSQPYAIGMKDDSVFAFAGIWEHWQDPARNLRFESYSIVTTEANELVACLAIHGRMPVILAPHDYERWLNPGDPRRPPVDLLHPFPSDRMRSWPVKHDVGNVKNKWSDLIDPVEPAQLTLL